MIDVKRSIGGVAAPAGPPTGANDLEQVMSMFVEFRHAMGELRCAALQGTHRTGVSMTQFHVLTLLEHHGALPMSRLAEMLDVSLSNATGLIDRMEEAGLVERVRDADDRRVVHVRPSDRGRAAREQVELMRDDVMRRLLARLDREQLDRLTASLRDLRDAVVEELRATKGHEH